MSDRRTIDLDREIERLGEWFHNIHLPGGVQTAPRHPLGDFPARKWHKVARCIPADLHGARVLDIGCNAGFYSFALAARGAEVLGIDTDTRYLAQAEWARGRLGLTNPPTFERRSVYRLQGLGRRFDLVWFMGVAYHLRHPLLALDIVRSVTDGHLMFQTMMYPEERELAVPADLSLAERRRIAEPGWPKLAFIEHRLAGDPTNWWVANAACAEAMLRSSGFEVLAAPENETCWCRAVQPPEAAREELLAVLGTEQPDARASPQDARRR